MGDNSETPSPVILDPSLPKWIILQLLEHCNLRCRMCYQWGENGPYREKTTLSRLDVRVVERIIDECRPARPYYELYGGEPLLHPHIGEILRAIRSAGSQVQLSTNGTLLAKRADLLVETAPERIWVSLDGPPEINDRQRGESVFARAVEGIDRLHATRERCSEAYPLIGVNVAVTPLNYRYLETFVLDSLDLSKIDCVSVELQAYLTERDHGDYVHLLGREFGVTAAPIARGFVNDPAIFKDMDFGLLARQVAKIAARCQDESIYLNTYPKFMTEDNIRKYFTADWFSMSGIKTRCSFPWISTEISARGDVTSCHAFYDLSLGNVYESSIIDIWRGERYARYRKYLRKSLLPICQSCCLFYHQRPPASAKREPSSRSRVSRSPIVD
jgi:radical SAM protein with 4Fe4S-binding SPASM domain